jgi:hypothetical protein
MIPKGMTHVKFRAACYEQAGTHALAFHSDRHAYAQNRYRELVKAPCPLEAGWEHKGRITKLAAYLAMPAAESEPIKNVLILAKSSYSRIPAERLSRRVFNK